MTLYPCNAPSIATPAAVLRPWRERIRAASSTAAEGGIGGRQPGHGWLHTMRTPRLISVRY
jgi:hypothetical protein